MTFEIMVCKSTDVMSFLEVKITRCDSSKQEWKKPSKLTTDTETFKEKENSIKKKEPIFLKYTYILIIMHYFDLW
jgi:hypothetical protein